jgi:glycosyl hydrolase family 42 (putative beta-galactosidase)
LHAVAHRLLDSPLVVEALHQYVVRDGTLVVTPFTAYMDYNGVFRDEGFGANLLELTGGLVRTVRCTGSPDVALYLRAANQRHFRNFQI